LIEIEYSIFYLKKSENNAILFQFINQFIKESRKMAQTIKDQCADPTKTITVEIPCRIAERVEAYANDNKTSFANVMIEALDAFLRSQKVD
jgi:hypothetical protein